ncbi:hypothetical protein IMCC21906_03059 [Spongiibacter sp. IMCC21906]|jgi:hypothetical protein|uniref:hypothetical protein n=1 Tax=Spongiibacter sp. IMCC21906 TaxID=1620392 RepID=UPI00062E02BE|nr:hypothetical protein [Spongiibacter sp. IMCC21906]AKH70699.1 hypothetical protein IMCC21906_03059 [Spongiibacter sp. IMCC21906]
MQGLSNDNGEKCPFDLNFEADTFKVGDLVSYRVSGSMMDMPFVGVLSEVHDDYVLLAHFDGSETPAGPFMRGTRESRPVVSEEDALKD